MTALVGMKRRCASQREEQLRWCGGGRKDSRGERDAEFGQARLGLLAGGVAPPDGAAATAASEVSEPAPASLES
jgi:hypothetical protein